MTEIYDIINENRDDLALSADILIDHANKNGGKDNITVSALVRYPDEIPIPGIKAPAAEE